MNRADLYEQYKTKMQKIADVKYASAVLQWDQETYLPAKGNDSRGRQIASLNEIAHQMFTANEMGELLNDLQDTAGLNLQQTRNVQLSLEDYVKNKRLSSDFVRKLSMAVNKSFHAWILARKENSFSHFQQPLDDLIQLKKQEADMLGYLHHPYDALLNEYDKGLTVANTDKVFSELKPKLVSLLNSIKQKKPIDNSFLKMYFNKDVQWKFGIDLLTRMHFDWEAGRQDISEHPFTTSFNNADVRITTRIDEQDFSNMTWSCIHEGGHALYEQGMNSAEYGLPLGEYCSISIHESQSRLWENCIGRGKAFWQYNLPIATKYFPAQFNQVTIEKFYAAINKVEPSLLRTEADEITYHLHIIIRYEMEKMLIAGSLQTKDIPSCWNELYEKYLGIKVPDDNHGCLQDVHWSHGSFGYFATYSFGSLYAAQFYTKMLQDYPALEKEIAAGENGGILNWLKQQIFRHGRYYTSEQLCQEATGESLNSHYFLSYITKKMNDIYTQ